MPQRSDADFLQVRVGERRRESEVEVARVGLAVQAGGRAVEEHYDYEYAMKLTGSQYNATIISGYFSVISRMDRRASVCLGLVYAPFT